jgi:hypothetical protein
MLLKKAYDPFRYGHRSIRRFVNAPTLVPHIQSYFSSALSVYHFLPASKGTIQCHDAPASPAYISIEQLGK